MWPVKKTFPALSTQIPSAPFWPLPPIDVPDKVLQEIDVDVEVVLGKVFAGLFHKDY